MKGKVLQASASSFKSFQRLGRQAYAAPPLSVSFGICICCAKELPEMAITYILDEAVYSELLSI